MRRTVILYFPSFERDGAELIEYGRVTMLPPIFRLTLRYCPALKDAALSAESVKVLASAPVCSAMSATFIV